VDDYHHIEETSPVRHEFYDGEIFAMAGGSVAHNHLSANVLSLLRVALATTRCSAFGSDMRLVTPGGLLTYPDGMVICGNIELVPGRQDEVTNPLLLIEILSDATRNYDRGEKFGFYKTIPTFREYLVIEQTSVGVEHHVRDEAGLWSHVDYGLVDQVVNLASVPVKLPLVEVYRKVFEPSAPAGSGSVVAGDGGHTS
jgi:Uma2 family endonuclease